jgi:hypothetical protein
MHTQKLTPQELQEIQRLRAWMDERGYNQTMLGNATDVDLGNLNKMLNGERRVSPKFKLHFGYAFGDAARDQLFPYAVPV